MNSYAQQSYNENCVIKQKWQFQVQELYGTKHESRSHLLNETKIAQSCTSFAFNIYIPNTFHSHGVSNFSQRRCNVVRFLAIERRGQFQKVASPFSLKKKNSL